MNRLKKKLKDLEETSKNGKVPICFGSNKVFREQFHLENKTHEEWKKDWIALRNNQFFSIGSKIAGFGEMMLKSEFVKKSI